MAQAYWEVQSNPKVHEGDVELDDNIIAREAASVSLSTSHSCPPSDVCCLQNSRTGPSSKAAAAMGRVTGTRRLAWTSRSTGSLGRTSSR